MNTALDFPDCRACQMWEDAGASWPRSTRLRAEPRHCHQHQQTERAAMTEPLPCPTASDYDCEHGHLHGECWVIGCNHQAPNAKGRPWREAPEWTI